MQVLDRFWWFRKLETAKAQLYRDGQINRNTPGFNHIAAAVEYGTNWTNLPGERLEQGGENEIRVEIDGETYQFEDKGYNLFEIERVEDKDAYPTIDEMTGRPPITQTIFTLKYRPRAADESGVPLLAETAPFFAVQAPPGQLPRQIQEHKERLVFRLGASLLFVGFVLQLIPSIATVLS
jgi:hypothetical protein